MTKRPGFTLIETVFAIFVFAVGALALAGTTAVVIRSLAEAAAREKAARIASSRMEILRSLGCGLASAGNQSTQGFRSTWTVSPIASGGSALVTVTYVLGGATRTDTFSALFPCSQ